MDYFDCHTDWDSPQDTVDLDKVVDWDRVVDLDRVVGWNRAAEGSRDWAGSGTVGIGRFRWEFADKCWGTDSAEHWPDSDSSLY